MGKKTEAKNDEKWNLIEKRRKETKRHSIIEKTLKENIWTNKQTNTTKNIIFLTETFKKKRLQKALTISNCTCSNLIT